MAEEKKITKKEILLWVLQILFAATLIFVWGNSMKTATESHGDSTRVLKLIQSFLEWFVGEGNVTNYLVRKLAHFCEYGLLGCELALILIIRSKVKLQWIVNVLFAALLIAVADETIQVFSGRGSKVTDVVLDFAGSFTGISAVLLIRFVWLGLIKKNKRQRYGSEEDDKKYSI